MRWGVIAIFMVSGFLAACSASAYKDQIASLADSGSALVSASGAYDNIKTSDWFYDQRLDDVVAGKKLSYSLACEDEARDITRRIADAAIKDRHLPDDVMTGYLVVKRCDLLPAGETDDRNQPALKAARDEKKPDDAGDKPALQKAESRLTAACSRRPIIAAGPGGTAEVPSSKVVMAALNRYLKALKAITDSDTIGDLQKNEKAAGDAVNGLIKTVSAPPAAAPAANLFFALFNIGVEQARYDALKGAILTLECAVSANTPALQDAIKASLRVRHGVLINARAADAALAATHAAKVLNNGAVLHDTGTRMLLFQQIQPDVAARSDDLWAAIKADPGKTVDDFFAAHHKLALAVVDTDLQLGPVFDSLSQLATSAAALNSAVNPAEKS